MSYSIEYQPAYKDSIVGQDLIYSVLSSESLSASNYKFKYWVKIYEGNTGTATSLIATLKFSANEDGYGIVNIRSIIESYCSPDNLGCSTLIFGITTKSEFKGVPFEAKTAPHPIHLIDKFCLNVNTARNYNAIFGEEYSTTPDGPPVDGAIVAGPTGLLFNGIDSGQEQRRDTHGNYGVDLANWDISLDPSFGFPFTGVGYVAKSGSGQQKFLTTSHVNVSAGHRDMVYQYLNTNDYHTLGVTVGAWDVRTSGVYYAGLGSVMQVIMYDADGVQVTSFSVQMSSANGGYNGTADTALTSSQRQIQYFGCGPANFTGAGITVPPSWDTYKITLQDSLSLSVGTPYWFKRRDDDCKGFETIRLTWLNKFGCWDYYSFTKKNERSTKIKRPEIKNNLGVWNSGGYSKYAYQGGRAVLNTAATKVVKAVSDWFTSDIEAAWIEGLFVSNEVYILNGFDDMDTGAGGAEFSKYITPVIVKSKKYTKFTQANDKLDQYEIEVEYSINSAVQKA